MDAEQRRRDEVHLEALAAREKQANERLLVAQAQHDAALQRVESGIGVSVP